MLDLAGEDINGIECNAIEETLPKPSYTIDTLQVLRKHYKCDCRLYFIMGADAFLDILTWKSYQEILNLVNIILSLRKGCRTEQLSDLFKKLDTMTEWRLWHGEDGKKDIYILKKLLRIIVRRVSGP